jgi:hypothetical protein
MEINWNRFATSVVFRVLFTTGLMLVLCAFGVKISIIAYLSVMLLFIAFVDIPQARIR